MRYSVEMWFFGADSLFKWGPSFRLMKLFHWTRFKVVWAAFDDFVEDMDNLVDVVDERGVEDDGDDLDFVFLANLPCPA